MRRDREDKGDLIAVSKNPVVKKHKRMYNFAKTDLMFTQRCGNKCEEFLGMELELTNFLLTKL